MPNVPQVPGVPALSSYAPNSIGLVLTDAINLIATFFTPVWGIFIDGSPFITPASIIDPAISSTVAAISAVASLVGVPNVIPCVASTVEFDYTAESPISNYPQEDGAFQSYNKVQLPADIRLKLACGGGVQQRQAFFAALEALRTSTALFDIVTPEGVFTDYNCKHVDYRRTGAAGFDLVIADVWFEQINVITATSFSNTATPTASGVSSLGNVQPQAPTSGLQAQFDSQSASQGLF